jgi:hypothetical protein
MKPLCSGINVSTNAGSNSRTSPDLIDQQKLLTGRSPWHGGDHACVAWLFAGRYRMANASKDQAANFGRLSKNTGMTGSKMIPSFHEQCDQRASARV